MRLKEPIRQSYLKELRSNAYEHVTELLEKGFISRTKDKNGRSYNLKTTPKFAEYFKLKGDAKTLAKLLDTTKDIKKLIIYKNGTFGILLFRFFFSIIQIKYIMFY